MMAAHNRSICRFIWWYMLLGTVNVLQIYRVCEVPFGYPLLHENHYVIHLMYEWSLLWVKRYSNHAWNNLFWLIFEHLIGLFFLQMSFIYSCAHFVSFSWWFVHRIFNQIVCLHSITHIHIHTKKIFYSCYIIALYRCEAFIPFHNDFFYTFSGIPNVIM